MSTATQTKSPVHCDHKYRHARVHFDEHLGAALLYMKPEPRPCFTSILLEEMRAFQNEVVRRVRSDLDHGDPSQIRYSVLASDAPGLFSLGGDLNLFANLIQKKDRAALLDYAIKCVRIVHQYSTCLELPLTTISLVQGNAQGGGFEAALSCNVIIAERGTQMGFPEVLFNLFPGMGAYSFLSRRINPALAERLILSGKLYPAEALYEMGVVDYLADPGKGREKLKDYIHESDRRSHSRSLIRLARTKYNRVPYEELLDITELWVDSALQLTERELKTMQRLVRAQNRRGLQSPAKEMPMMHVI